MTEGGVQKKLRDYIFKLIFIDIMFGKGNLKYTS